MLRTLFVFGIGLVIASGTAMAQAAEPLDLLEKAIAAHGGKEALAKNNARTVNTKSLVSVGTVKFGYTGTLYFQYPNKFRVEGRMIAGDEISDLLLVVNGMDGWEKEGDGATNEMKDHMLHAFQRNLQAEYASTLVPLLNKKNYIVSSIGEHDVNGKKTVGLNVKNTADETLSLKLYFDQKTNLMVKQEYSSKNMFLGGEVLVETYLSQHKKIDGITMPMQYDIHYHGIPAFTFTFESMKHHEELDASLFEKPE